MAILASGLPDVVDDDEELARYLTSRGQYSSNGVKQAAFIPNRNGETSVFRHGAQPREALWRIADDYVIVDQTLHGAAIVRARYIRAAQLEVEASEPPPRHADIVGWPQAGADPELVKARRKELALLIAQRASLIRRQ
jgi:hypothetical protein